MIERFRWPAAMLATALGVSGIDDAAASEVTVVNRGCFPIACTAKGWKDDTARPRVFIAAVGGEARTGIAPADGNAILDWVQCGGVQLSRLAMRDRGPIACWS